jgi:hypothetical protein
MTQATTNTLKNNTKFDWNKLIMKIKELAFYFHLSNTHILPLMMNYKE